MKNKLIKRCHFTDNIRTEICLHFKAELLQPPVLVPERRLQCSPNKMVICALNAIESSILAPNK